MRVLFLLLCLAIRPALADGTFVAPLDPSKNHILFIEPIENDGFMNLSDKLKFFANAHGFETTDDKATAGFRMKADYTYSITRIDAYVKISTMPAGDMVYSGTGYARMGALIAPGNTTWKAFQEALSGFQE